jgi:hypothetical protein
MPSCRAQKEQHSRNPKTNSFPPNRPSIICRNEKHQNHAKFKKWVQPTLSLSLSLLHLPSNFAFTSKTRTKTTSSSASDAAPACRSAASRCVAAATCAGCPSRLCSSLPHALFWAACWLLRRSGGRGLVGC